MSANRNHVDTCHPLLDNNKETKMHTSHKEEMKELCDNLFPRDLSPHHGTPWPMGAEPGGQGSTSFWIMRGARTRTKAMEHQTLHSSTSWRWRSMMAPSKATLKLIVWFPSKWAPVSSRSNLIRFSNCEVHFCQQSLWCVTVQERMQPSTRFKPGLAPLPSEFVLARGGKHRHQRQQSAPTWRVASASCCALL